MYVRTDGWMYGCMDVCMDDWTFGCTYAHTHARTRANVCTRVDNACACSRPPETIYNKNNNNNNNNNNDNNSNITQYNIHNSIMCVSHNIT